MYYESKNMAHFVDVPFAILRAPDQGLEIVNSMKFEYIPGTDDPKETSRRMITDMCTLRYRDLTDFNIPGGMIFKHKPGTDDPYSDFMDAEMNKLDAADVRSKLKQLAAIADEPMIARYDERYVQNLTEYLQSLDCWVGFQGAGDLFPEIPKKKPEIPKKKKRVFKITDVEVAPGVSV